MPCKIIGPKYGGVVPDKVLLFTPWPGAHSNGIRLIVKSPNGEEPDARSITVLAGCRAASARHRMDSNDKVHKNFVESIGKMNGIVYSCY